MDGLRVPLNHSKCQATSTDLHVGDGAGDAQGHATSTMGTQSRALPGAARMSHAQPPT